VKNLVAEISLSCETVLFFDPKELRFELRIALIFEIGIIGLPF
jgi:hypothetical protein